jgi:hypothetical protein
MFFLMQKQTCSEDLVRKLIDALRVGRSWLNRIAYNQSNRLLILLERAETEIRFRKANGMFNKKLTSIATVPN